MAACCRPNPVYVVDVCWEWCQIPLAMADGSDSSGIMFNFDNCLDINGRNISQSNGLLLHMASSATPNRGVTLAGLTLVASAALRMLIQPATFVTIRLRSNYVLTGKLAADDYLSPIAILFWAGYSTTSSIMTRFLTDVIMLCLPLTVISKLQLSLPKKIGIALVFMSGIFTPSDKTNAALLMSHGIEVKTHRYVELNDVHPFKPAFEARASVEKIQVLDRGVAIGFSFKATLWQVLHMAHAWTPALMQQVAADVYNICVITFATQTAWRNPDELTVTETTMRGGYNSRHVFPLYLDFSYFRRMISADYYAWEFQYPPRTVAGSAWC
ncbi:hypothetical protein DL770_009287 [Monosporascus sp. CRB-9-2]|nr:hypothetical protein DL770_009287 [Monosporascus sp. CRB-9-2]